MEGRKKGGVENVTRDNSFVPLLLQFRFRTPGMVLKNIHKQDIKYKIMDMRIHNVVVMSSIIIMRNARVYHETSAASLRKCDTLR